MIRNLSQFCLIKRFSRLRPTANLNLGFDNLGHRRISFTNFSRFIKKRISNSARELSSLQSDVPIILRPSMLSV